MSKWPTFATIARCFRPSRCSTRDDVRVARAGDHDVDLAEHVLERRDLVAVHRRLQRRDRVDLADDHAGALAAQRIRGALADVAVTRDEGGLAADQHVGGPVQAVDERVADAVPVVELALRDGVVHVDRREEQLAVAVELVEAVHAGGGLLGDAADVGGDALPALRVAVHRAAEHVEHRAPLGAVRRPSSPARRRRARTRTPLCTRREASPPSSRIIVGPVKSPPSATCLRGPVEDALGAVPVLLDRLALPGEHRHAARVRVGVPSGPTTTAAAASSWVEKMLQLAQRTCAPSAVERLDQHGRLDRHVQGAGDAGPGERPGLRRSAPAGPSGRASPARRGGSGAGPASARSRSATRYSRVGLSGSVSRDVSRRLMRSILPSARDGAAARPRPPTAAPARSTEIGRSPACACGSGPLRAESPSFALRAAAAPGGAGQRPKRVPLLRSGSGAGAASSSSGRGDAQHGPAVRRREPVRVVAAEVVAVRLGLQAERPEHGHRVGVDVGEGRDGRLLAGHPRAEPFRRHGAVMVGTPGAPAARPPGASRIGAAVAFASRSEPHRAARMRHESRRDGGPEPRVPCRNGSLASRVARAVRPGRLPEPARPRAALLRHRAASAGAAHPGGGVRVGPSPRPPTTSAGSGPTTSATSRSRSPASRGP